MKHNLKKICGYGGGCKLKETRFPHHIPFAILWVLIYDVRKHDVTGRRPITVIIFEFSRYNSFDERYLRVWLLLKQGYQMFQIFLKSTLIYRRKLARARPW